MLSVEEVTDSSILHARWPEWHTLSQQCSQGSFFETPEWLLAWLEHFWVGKPIRFLFVYDERRLVGMAPFLDDSDGDLWCCRSLTLPIHPHSFRSGVLVADADNGPVLSSIISHLRRERPRTAIVFPTVDIRSPMWRDLPGVASTHGLVSAAWKGPAVSFIRLSGDWGQYLQSRSAHVRCEIRRKRHRAETAGVLEWATVSAIEHCDDGLAAVLKIEGNSWKHAAGTSFANEPGVRPFYEAVAKRAASAGWFRLHLLYLDSDPIAHVYGVEYKNEYLAIKTSYDQKYRDLSPGAVIFEFALRDAFDRGLSVFDLLGVESRWKRELGTDKRHEVAVCAFSATDLRCRACRAYRLQLKPLVKRLLPSRVVAWASRTEY
jgi:CelD/BcsL family acetyltransferase involved in cellulose biosynthesis